MRVLLFGSRGFIGSRIQSALTSQDVQCMGVSRDDFDFLDFDSLDRVLQSFQPSHIIYAAGINKRFTFLDYHCLSEHKILAKLSSCSAKLIYLSSTLVYGAPTILPIKEQSELNPSGEYGFYKLICEDIVRSADNYLILRLSSIISKTKQNSAFYKIFEHLTGQDSPSTLVMKYSDSSRDYLHVNLCSKIIGEIIFTASNCAINVSASKSLKLSSIFEELRREMCLPCHLTIGFGGKRVEDPDSIEINNQLMIEHCSPSLATLISTHSPVLSFLYDAN